MATMNSASLSRANEYAWLPVFCGLAVICFESRNSMGAGQTAIWLSELIQWTGHQATATVVEIANHTLRKGGHFTGYGLLGVFFARAWFALLRRRVVSSWSGLRLLAGAYAVGCTFLVATCDEVHQIFLPTRGASPVDVLLDTSGALTLNLIFFGYLALQRRSLLSPNNGPLTTLGLRVAARVSTPQDVRRLVRSSTRNGVAAIQRSIRKA